MSKPKLTTIYVCHGWAYSVTNWQKVEQLLLKQNIKLIIFKIPGLTLPSKKVFTIDDYVDWLDVQLKDIKHPIVLGHSNGGRMALNYCLKHPKKMKHLILVSPAGIPASGWQNCKLVLIKIVAKICKPLAKITWIRRLGYKIFGVSDYDKAQPNMKQTLTNMLTSDKLLKPVLNQIQVPISFIWGELDKTTPIANLSIFRSQLQTIEHSFLLPNCGHVPYVSHAEDLAEYITKIVRDINKGRR